MDKKTKILGYEAIKGNEVAVILCEERTDTNLVGAMKFYCDFCKKDHIHGIGEGHRLQHCFDVDSPFDQVGYIITLNPNYFSKEKGDEIKIKITKGEEADKLRIDILDLINEYSEEFNGYELLGILDVVRRDVHESLDDRN